MRGRPFKLALVLSAGANTRLGDECPPGGKAHVQLGDGTTPWLRTRAMLMERGWLPVLVELATNPSGDESAIYVDHSHGPAWAVREALHVLGISWSKYQLLVWYGDTVLTEWDEPQTLNYTVCATEPIGVGRGRGRGYDREWDWGTGFAQPLARGRRGTGSESTPERGTGSSQPTESKVDFSQPARNWPCVGIYHFRSPEIWMKSFDEVVPEFQDPAVECYRGLEVGMVEVANRYAEIEKESHGALRALQIVDVATWLDVGDVGSLNDVREVLETT